MIDPELQRALVAEAALAPSVHNVQPARWRFDSAGATLFEDSTRRLPAGDPQGRDTAVSLGAAAEGMAIALSRHGLRLAEAASLPPGPGPLRPVQRFDITPGGLADPLTDAVEQRVSFRGNFAPATATDRAAADALGAADVAVLSGPEELARLGGLYDEAGLAFFRDAAFRAELVSWMRFSPRHLRWNVDGLNAAAMAMSRLEAVGAGALLGRLFPLADRIGLSGPLTSEAAKVRSAAAMLVIHRPAVEDPFESGRAFYRLWLRVAAAGLQGAVMASLADHEGVAARLHRQLALPADRRITSAMRVGRSPPGADYPRARLPVEQLLV